MKTSKFTQLARRLIRAFSLIEMMVVLTIISAVIYALLPPTANIILSVRISTERTALTQIFSAAQGSFNSGDLENINVAAVTGDIPPGTDATSFSTSTSYTTIPGTTNTYDWFAKVARIMGYTPQLGVAPSVTAQPAISTILLNSFGNVRMFFAAPAENNQQRFMLVSLMCPAGELALPPFQATKQWFDDIWNNQWTNTSTIPANWNSELTAAQVNAWNHGYGGTNCWKLVVVPITLRRFTITANNSHPTDTAWIYYNGNNFALHTAGDSQVGISTAASGVSTVPSGPTGILAGRQIVVTRGTSESGAATVQQFYLTDYGQVVIQ